MNHGSHGVYNTGSSIKFKTSIIKSSLCHHSDTYILLKEIITVPNTGTAAAPNNRSNRFSNSDIINF